MNTEIREKIKGMLVENLRLNEADFDYETELFEELGLDSIDSLEIISGVDNLFGVNMNGADREYFQSVESIAKYVETHMEEQQ